MNTSSLMFGHCLERAFDRETSGKRMREVALFRTLMRAFNALRPRFHVEEYHGTKSRIQFSGAPPWTRSARPSCELSDLAIVWLRGGKARVTFLQAKWSGKDYYGCDSDGYINESFRGDSTQWYLLNKRPSIAPTHSNFRPPENLLSDAMLPSVCSYGLFYEQAVNRYGFLYASADVVMCPRPTRPSAKVPLDLLTTNYVSGYSGRIEQKWACCLSIFGSALHAGRVGTPIHDSTSISDEERQYRHDVSRWLARMLRSRIVNVDAESLAAQFIRLTGGIPSVKGSLHFEDAEDGPTILLVNGGSEQESPGGRFA